MLFGYLICLALLPRRELRTNLRLTLFPFLVFVVGRRFLVKTIAEHQWCCFRFSAIVLSSSALAKKRSELNGCRKTLTLERLLVCMRLRKARWMHETR